MFILTLQTIFVQTHIWTFLVTSVFKFIARDGQQQIVFKSIWDFSQHWVLGSWFWKRVTYTSNHNNVSLYSARSVRSAASAQASSLSENKSFSCWSWISLTACTDGTFLEFSAEQKQKIVLIFLFTFTKTLSPSMQDCDPKHIYRNLLLPSMCLLMGVLLRMMMNSCHC